MVAYLPLRLTRMAHGDASSGAEVLKKFHAPERVPHIAYQLGCERGTQSLSVLLSDGTRTEPVQVENMAYNAVQDIQLLLPDGKKTNRVKLKVGQRIESARLVAVMASHPRFTLTAPELTGLSCLRDDLRGQEYVSVKRLGKWPGATVTIEALKPGVAVLELEYPGPRDAPPVRASIALEVEGAAAKKKLVWVLTRITRTGRGGNEEAESKGVAVTPGATDAAYERSWSGKKMRVNDKREVEYVPYTASVSTSWEVPATMEPGADMTMPLSVSASSSGPRFSASVSLLCSGWKSERRPPSPPNTRSGNPFSSYRPSMVRKVITAETGQTTKETVKMIVPDTATERASVSFDVSVACDGAAECGRMFTYESRFAP